MRDKIFVEAEDHLRFQDRRVHRMIMSRNDRNWRQLAAKDSERIKCSGAFAMETCANRATWCETVKWSTGSKDGLSFFYLCDSCKERNLANRRN